MTLRRGDVVTMADRSGEFNAKPRSVVVVKASAFLARATCTICPITSLPVDAPLFRFQLDPSDELPLDHRSWIEVDLITTVRSRRIGRRIGRMATPDLMRLTASLAVFLGIG